MDASKLIGYCSARARIGLLNQVNSAVELRTGGAGEITASSRDTRGQVRLY